MSLQYFCQVIQLFLRRPLPYAKLCHIFGILFRWPLHQTKNKLSKNIFSETILVFITVMSLLLLFSLHKGRSA